jgi:hypothetical protein
VACKHGSRDRIERGIIVIKTLRRRLMFKVIVVNDLCRHFMTKVPIANPLHDLTRKVFAVKHLFRCFMPRTIVVAFACGLMLSAWGVARAEENSAPAVQTGSGQGPATSVPATSAPVTSGPATSAPVTSGTAKSAPATSEQAATSGQATSAAAQPASGAVPDEVVFREDEWVAYLNLPADQEAALKRALAVKHRHMSELAGLPGVWLVWVDADKDQPPIIRVDVKEETPEIDRLVPAEIEGVPVEVVKADPWFLMAPPYAAPTNSIEGTPHGQLSPDATQAAGQGASNSRASGAVSLSGWSKIGPVESERNCERSKAFLIWLATDPRFVAHYKQVMQQQRGANWSYDQSKMAEMYRDGICVAGSDPRLAGK